MDSAEFRKLVAKYFAPQIRELGWKGSGFHFRKFEDNHIVKVFGFQGAWYGGSVCCETAIHFDFLDDLAGKPFDKATYGSCLIRERLSPKGKGDYHWRFSNKEEQNIKSVKEILSAFEKYGQRFYKDFENFPYPFTKIKARDLKKRPNYKLLGKYYVHSNIHLAWLLKEINLFIGKNEKASEFADFGIKTAIEHANIMAKNSGKLDTQYIEMNKKLFNL